MYIVNHKILSKEFKSHIAIKQKIGFSVAIFGSSRIKKDNSFYKAAYNLSKKLAKESITIITGGGPGIMEAANKGAHKVNGISCGFRISLPFEEKTNEFISQENFFSFDYFFSRKAAFLMHSDAFIVFPGGFGTVDELFEILVHIQNGKMKSLPIFLYGNSFWEDLIYWVKNRLDQLGLIDTKDLSLLTVTDDINHIFHEIKMIKSLKNNKMVA